MMAAHYLLDDNMVDVTIKEKCYWKEKIIRELQFKEVRFTTKPEVMSIGYALYQKMGFEELENDNGTVLMRMMLD